VSEPETESEEEWVIEYKASDRDEWRGWIVDYCYYTLRDAQEAVRSLKTAYPLICAWRIVHETTVYTVTREVVE
jgi:hypothetical protein